MSGPTGPLFLSGAVATLWRMDIRDLDVIVPEPKRVRFGGAEYDLPPDLPMEIFLRINQAGMYKTDDGQEDTPRQIDSLTDSLTDLFTWQMEEKGIEPEQLALVKSQVRQTLMRRGTRYCFSLVREIYRDDDKNAEEAAAEADPTEPQAPPAEA